MATTSQIEKFIKTLYPAAVQVEKETGLPALAIIAQSALETGWGASAPGNMYFGFKVPSGWTGKKQLLWTHEYINGVYTRVQDWFCAYDSPIESLRHYAGRIISLSRYATAAKTTDPYQYARELQKAGYATDPNYADKIIKNIDIVKKKSLS
ncbi:Muramidase (Flagellum-specific) (fragment) [uncultured Paludibacter sp.]